MKRRLRWLAYGAAALLAAALAFFFFVLPGIVDNAINRVLEPPPYTVSQQAEELHEGLIIADLHADTLLWGRDLLHRGTRGQVDIPRLIEGGVALQAFTVVTKRPKNSTSSATTTHATTSRRWPWPSAGRRRPGPACAHRALHQADRLRDGARRSREP